MQRFKQYLDKEFLFDAVADSPALVAAGLRCDNIPTAPGKFEELEFAGDLNGEPLLMCVAIVGGTIKRMMFVMSKPGDPDDVRPLSDSELRDLARQKGDHLGAFFDSVTR
jgi:hypothetical protein